MPRLTPKQAEMVDSTTKAFEDASIEAASNYNADGLGLINCRLLDLLDEVDALRERAEQAERDADEARADRKVLMDGVQAIADAASRLSPGPYVWAMYQEAEAAQRVTEMLAYGSGDVHGVYLPSHPLSVVGPDAERPQHAVMLCITGNGPASQENAKALAELLSRCAALTRGGGE